MQWEYMVIDIAGTNSQDEHRLNNLGKNCWELVAIGADHEDRRLAYLKRPLAEIRPTQFADFAGLEG